MRYMEIDSVGLRLDIPRFNPEHALHFGQYFRLYNLLTLLGVNNTEEDAKRYARSYAWNNTLCDVSELLATSHSAANIPTAVNQTANMLEREFREILSGLDLTPLQTKTFSQISSEFGVGFASCFIGDFYCLKCRKIENMQGVIVNALYGVMAISPDAAILHEHFKNGHFHDPYPRTQSCPYCQSTNFDLGNWKRLLNRAPNVCECDACGR